MNPLAVLDVAVSLAKQSDEISEEETDEELLEKRDALIRSSVSRSYYSVFLFAREVAAPLGYQEPEELGVSVHADLWTFYKGIDRKLSKRCDGLKKYRRKADYDIYASFNVNASDQAVAAMEIIEILDELGRKALADQGIVVPEPSPN